MATWDTAQRRVLQQEMATTAAGPLTCPACGGAVVRSPVTAPPGVSYVRHRVLLVCAGCRRSAALDLPAR